MAKLKYLVGISVYLLLTNKTQALKHRQNHKNVKEQYNNDQYEDEEMYIQTQIFGTDDATANKPKQNTTTTTNANQIVSAAPASPTPTINGVQANGNNTTTSALTTTTTDT